MTLANYLWVKTALSSATSSARPPLSAETNFQKLEKEAVAERTQSWLLHRRGPGRRGQTRWPLMTFHAAGPRR